ncbi:GNAT family N-acetyltransferase [soil metagenome]
MTAPAKVLYASEPALPVDDFIRVLLESGLGATRPTGDIPRMARMLKEADLIVTARLDQPDRPLVGVARAITDFSWCCYLSELAVSAAAQGLGVGKGLIDETRRLLGPQVSLILASMPDSTGFYERIGMPRQADAFWFKRSK